MPPCPSCGADLDTEWKYCIYCGVALAPAAVPGAIRAADAPDERPRTRLDVPLLIGIVLGVAGVALLVYMGIVLFGPA
ncbi:zinc ribbon domain-containing protein [Salinibacterium sp. SYSU T00001]|uniref:zinc ribbon domain-containing protein n=1 Tax=Homoserinimonas sedimenticola TaxID=2986805 RepID=UPI002236A50B|nr:zinc ribbon domain-containing protein [Salinibacterium sedimenticola]MCW4386023.1 zinc ribbon domain-containing protein [Salinibacterium sedimenticola]